MVQPPRWFPAWSITVTWEPLPVLTCMGPSPAHTVRILIWMLVSAPPMTLSLPFPSPCFLCTAIGLSDHVLPQPTTLIPPPQLRQAPTSRKWDSRQLPTESWEFDFQKWKLLLYPFSSNYSLIFFLTKLKFCIHLFHRAEVIFFPPVMLHSPNKGPHGSLPGDRVLYGHAWLPYPVESEFLRADSMTGTR